VNGVDIIIGNCLPEVCKILPILGTGGGEFPIRSMTLVAICLVIPQRMRISGTVMEIWTFEVLPRRLFQEQRSVGRWSVLNITLISYTPLRYVRNVVHEE